MQLLLAKYAQKGILVDTNVLLLYLVGILDTSLIARFKRTQNRGYTEQDFRLVQNLLSLFRQVVTTPQILAELSNLSMQMKDPLLTRYFKHAVCVFRGMREEYVDKDTVLASERLALLPQIGYTDLTMIEAARKSGYLVLTDDFKAAAFLQNANCDVINLNQIRGMLWLAD